MTYDDIVRGARELLKKGRCPTCNRKALEPNCDWWLPDVLDDDGNDLNEYCPDDFHWQCEHVEAFVHDDVRAYK